MPKVLRVLVLPLCVAACVPIPHRDLRLPGLVFRVRDPLGRAVPGAEVVVYAAVDNAVGEVAPVPLDAEGVGRLARQVDWHVVLEPARDNEEPWVWVWCASAPGFALVGGRLFEEPADTLRVTLHPSRTQSRCRTDATLLYQVTPPPGR